MIARRLTVALAALVLLPVVLAGCSLPGSGQPQPGNTGDNGAATSGPAPDGGGTEGDPYVGLPGTFPSDIPIIDGEVAQGIDVGTGWSLLIPVDDAVARFTEAADALVAAGYEERTRQTSETGGFGNFTNADYSINLSSEDTQDYGPAVAYTVVKLD